MSSALENSSFRYKPLTEPDSFRLLQLHPSSSAASQIECTLLHSTLSLCDREIIDHYTALSYVWGNPLETARISVDGHQLTITATLEAALRDLRDDTRILRVWADALCIDQSNFEERNRQVRQMGRIYSTAHHTVIHLGPLTPPIEMVLQATPYQLSNISENFQAAEKTLVNRPWFGRVWVFQELVLSRDPWVQCGGVRVRWTDLCDLLLSKDSKRAGLKLLTEMHFARERRIQTNLFNLLLSRRGLGANDARDMIFAHMGVASDKAALEGRINVDYQQSCERLYEDVAQYLIDTIGPETIFSHLDDINHSPGRQNLASWSPDWSLPPSSAIHMYKDNRMNVVSLNPKLHYTFIKEPRVLAYIGYKVDIISSISGGFYGSMPKNLPIYQTNVQSLQALYARVGGSYVSGDENGQYTRINLRGHETEHEKLCTIICDIWSYSMNTQQSKWAPILNAHEPHGKFYAASRKWLNELVKQGTILVGGDAEGMPSILYTHLHPNTPPSVLMGRRLAALKSGKVGVVPLQAREGDVVVYLAGNPTAMVLRAKTLADPKDLNQEIYDEFMAKRPNLMEAGGPYIKPFLNLLEAMPKCIEHSVIVGECYVDGEVGWSFKDRYEHHDFKIFALH
jgi:hypothetical protein